jgi:hypothetical protein
MTTSKTDLYGTPMTGGAWPSLKDLSNHMTRWQSPMGKNHKKFNQYALLNFEGRCLLTTYSETPPQRHDRSDRILILLDGKFYTLAEDHIANQILKENQS